MSALPRHMLRRLCALDLVTGILDSLAETVPSWKSEYLLGHVAPLCCRIAMHRERCFRLTVRGEHLDLSADDKASGRYMRAVEHMKRTITSSWPETVDATAFIAAVLTHVAECEEQLPRSMAYLDHRAEWGALHTLLGELYELFDPELQAVEHIEYGAQVGARMVSL
ncbi:MAG: hypothetical protein KKF77_01355 [Proteobacteria bacterium]|nr:hypothetical protein [Pseudomonadota bacterium]